MKKRNLFGLLAASACLPLLASACGLEKDVFSISCSLTEIADVGPVRAIRGVDPVPTGFDAMNTATCTYVMPMASITVELIRDGQTAFQQVTTLDPPANEITFPLPAEVVAVTPANLDPGQYERVIEAMAVDEETVEEVSSYVKVAKTIWVFDAAGSPETVAREALAEKVGVAPDAPGLVAYDEMEWSDASLDCPEPGMMYAQVITPGFKLVFEHGGALHEYHTNRDGSSVAFCAPSGTQ